MYTHTHTHDALKQILFCISGIIGGYNKQRRETSFVDQGQRLMDDSFTASVTVILNGVNAFLYQIMLAPLYFQVALQKTVVCTSNDVFAIFDATGTKIRLGRPDLQAASDVSSGVCMSAFFASKLDAFMETRSQGDVTDAATQATRSMSSAAGNSVLTGVGKETENLAGRSSRILQLMTGNKPFSTQAASSAIRNAMANAAGSRAGQKAKSLTDRLKNNKLVSRIGSLLGKLQIAMPVHTIDSFITYFIGVISGMQDMAQVLFCLIQSKMAGTAPSPQSYSLRLLIGNRTIFLPFPSRDHTAHLCGAVSRSRLGQALEKTSTVGHLSSHLTAKGLVVVTTPLRRFWA